jgi:hypothetical protein
VRLLTINFKRLLGAVVLVGIFLSGCLSMQIDITPEPDSIKADGIVDTPIPSQAPTQNSLPPTISLEAEGIEGEVIVVNVIDQTGGMLLEQGLEVQLDGYDQFELVYQDVKSLTTESSLVFDSVPFQAGRVFFASISHGGAIYRSDMFEAGDETTSIQMAIEIFETTTSDENILVERIHVLADFPSPHQVQIVEIFIVSNLGDSTYVADSPGETTLSFPLPVEAESISFDDGALGERYVKTMDGFGDTVSILPGAGVYQTLVYYTLPIQENTFEFSQVMSYPVRAAVIMTPEGEVIVEGANLDDMGVQAIPDGSVQVYSAMSIPRGESLQFRVTVESIDSVVPSDAPVFLPQWVIIAAGALGVALLLTGVWLFIRQRSRGFEDDEFEGTFVEREEILDSIIALEDLNQEGEITEKAYLKKHQELKDQLDSLADN